MGGKQVSGLAAAITDSTASVLDIGNFFGFKSAATADGRVRFNNGQLVTQSQLYGFTSDQNLETFSYAARIDFSIVAPLANLVGTYYKGTVRLGSLYNTNDLNINGTFTVANLIAVADEIGSMSSQFYLESAVVDDYILTHTLKAGADVVTNVLGDVELGSEIVSYIVLQTPVQSIADNTKMTYSLIGNSQSSNLVLASVANLLYYKTFNSIFQGKQRKEIDFQYQGPSSILAHMEPPRTMNQLVNQLNTTTAASTTEPSAKEGSSVFNYIKDTAWGFVPPPMKFYAWLAGLTKDKDLKMTESFEEEEEAKSLSDVAEQFPPFLISRKAAAIIAAIQAIKASSLACLLEDIQHPILASVGLQEVYAAADALRQFSIGVESRAKGLNRIAGKMESNNKLSRKEKALSKAVVSTQKQVKGSKQSVAMMKAGDNALKTAKRRPRVKKDRPMSKNNAAPPSAAN